MEVEVSDDRVAYIRRIGTASWAPELDKPLLDAGLLTFDRMFPGEHGGNHYIVRATTGDERDRRRARWMESELRDALYGDHPTPCPHPFVVLWKETTVCARCGELAP